MKKILPFLLTALSASAEFTYVDATLANSTLAGTPFTLTPPANYDVTDPDGDDGLWSYRLLSSFESGDYFETDNGRPPLGGSNDYESTPDIVTTIQLPQAGTYRIVALFANNGRRDIAARVGATPGASDIFNRANSLEADQTLSPLEIDFDSSYGNGRAQSASAANLGLVTTTAANEEIEVFINGPASTTTLDGDGRHDDERTRYDGVGYELQAPTTPKHHDVFIIAGQSNGDGRGLASALTGPLAEFSGVQSNAIIYYSNPGRYGDTSDPNYLAWVPLEPGYSVAPGESGPLPTNSFGHEIAAATILTEHFENVAFIKVTEGGTSLRVDWRAPIPDPNNVGPLYTDLITVVPQALQALTNQGDTYTLHSLYWHQGESDTGSSSQYPTRLDEFVQSVRSDLGKSNLRFIIGALAPERGPDFIPLQWQISRDLRNASFVSSVNLTTTDGTHFDTTSVVEMGLRVGEALAQHGRALDFGEDGFGEGLLNQQGDFRADPEIEIVATTDSGGYLGGLAAEESTPTGPHTGNLRRVLPLAEARSLKACLFAQEADSTLLLAGWKEDSNSDEDFQSNETALGIGLGSDGLFRIQAGTTESVSTGFSYQENHWYELEATWTLPDAMDQSTVSLFVTDLTNNTELNGGSPIATTTIASLSPATWEGTGILLDDGLLDNIGVEGPGFAGWIENRYPTLTGGVAGDDDSDGIANAFEYAYGLNPLVPNAGENCPSPFLNGSQFSLLLPELPQAEDVLVEVRESSDLQSWNTAEGIVTGNVRAFHFSTTDSPQLFLSPSLEICE